MEWIDARTPPPMTPQDGMWPRSDPVLVFDGASQFVAYLEQVDEDCPAKWRTACSEGWQLKGIKAWMPLPPDPLPFNAESNGAQHPTRTPGYRAGATGEK